MKIAFVFAGAATLERLLTTRNLLLFLGFSGICIGCLGLMKDFGTASIFFVTMLIIIVIRSGDWRVIVGISGLAAVAAIAITFIMPHVAKRFEAWRHVWQYASTSGYQQTRTMVAIGSGGLLGVGGGNGYLDGVNAASTDLVFGVVFEEWGGIIGPGLLCPFGPLRLAAGQNRSIGLLLHRRLRRCRHVPLPDGPQRFWGHRYPAPDRRNLSLRQRGRLEYPFLLGAARLLQGRG